MDLFLREVSGRIDPEDVLSKINALMDWPTFSPILKRGLKRFGFWPQGYDPLILFKCLLIGLLIGQWHGLSDPKLERALKVRLDLRLAFVLCLFSSHSPSPKIFRPVLSITKWIGPFVCARGSIGKTNPAPRREKVE